LHDGVAALATHDVDAVSVAGGFTFLGANDGIARVAGALGDAHSKSAYVDVTPADSWFASTTESESSTDGAENASSLAIVGFAAAGDDVVFGRNTAHGPQIWACAGGASSGCDPAQWRSLDVDGARVSAVASTGTSALIAVDDATGIRLYRYAPSTHALARLDRVDGLGTRVLASVVGSLAGNTWLYAIVSDESGAPRLTRILLETAVVDHVSG
jgi:hypothetical protein